MKKIVVLALFLMFIPLFAFANEVMKINWEKLQPESVYLQKNFDILSEEDQGKIFWVSYLKNNIPKERTEETAEVYDEFASRLATALPIAKALDIDVEKALSELKMMETGINPKLAGQRAQLPGYLIPLATSGKEVQDFLLVPYYGACIHTPPPPLNQIVYAHTKTPLPLTEDLVFKAVSLTGTFEVNSTISKELFLVDGSSDIEIGYSMDVDTIEDYKGE